MFAIKKTMKSQHGGFRLKLAFAIVTLACIIMAIFWMLSSHETNQSIAYRKAVEICEYGLQEALIKLQAEPTWNTGFPKTIYNDGWYSVTVKPNIVNDTLHVTVQADGHFGPAAPTRICDLQLVVENGDTTWRQISLR